MSAYRYEGAKVKDETAKSEAQTLSQVIKNAGTRNPIEDDEVIRILSTRSKPHLQEVYKHYREISGHNIDEVCMRIQNAGLEKNSERTSNLQTTSYVSFIGIDS